MASSAEEPSASSSNCQPERVDVLGRSTRRTLVTPVFAEVLATSSGRLAFVVGAGINHPAITPIVGSGDSVVGVMPFEGERGGILHGPGRAKTIAQPPPPPRVNHAQVLRAIQAQGPRPAPAGMPNRACARRTSQPRPYLGRGRRSLRARPSRPSRCAGNVEAAADHEGAGVGVRLGAVPPPAKAAQPIAATQRYTGRIAPELARSGVGDQSRVEHRFLD